MPTQCQNCSAPIQGDYCFECGQSATDFNLPVGEFAKEFAREAFSLDSRLRLTLKPLFFKPGAVPRAYVAGHRARFVPPIRLYIFASFTMFLIMALGPGATFDNVDVGDNAPGAVDSLTAPPEPAPGVEPADAGENNFGERLEERFVLAFQRVAADREAFTREFLNRLAQAMFFLLPAFAVLLKLVYLRRLYVHHVVFSVYFHSFVFFVVAFVALPDAVGLSAVSDWLGIALLSIPLYLLLGPCSGRQRGRSRCPSCRRRRAPAQRAGSRDRGAGPILYRARRA